MIRKLVFWFLGVLGLAGLMMFEVARWPAYQAVAHWWATDEPIKPANIPPESFLSGMAMMAFAFVGLWLMKRWPDRRKRSPPPPRPADRKSVV